jgi:DNA-binding transcriptional ArsR family regulator
MTTALRPALNTLELLGHPGRLAVLLALAESPMNVGSLASRAGTTYSAMSQTLALLRAGGLVEGSRRGKEVWYGPTGRGRSLAAAAARLGGR